MVVLKLRYYVVRRIFSAIITLLFVVLVAFILFYISLIKVPTGVARIFGANYSLPVLYFRYLHDVITGNLGYIPMTFPEFHAFPVTYVITLLLPDTLQLIVVSLVLAFLISVPLGTFSGNNKNSLGDTGIRIYSFFFFSMPVIFTALWIQMLFARGGYLGTGLPDTGPYPAGLTLPPFIQYGITFPTHVPIVDGLVNGDFQFAFGAFEHLIMPAMVLGLWTSSAMAIFLRGEIVEHLDEPYVTAARARGLPQRIVMKRYIRRNSYTSFITVTAPLFAWLIGWIVVTEYTFGYPGIGTFLWDSVTSYYPTGIATSMLVFGSILVIMNLVVDVTYAFLDPRIRY